MFSRESMSDSKRIVPTEAELQNHPKLKPVAAPEQKNHGDPSKPTEAQLRDHPKLKPVATPEKPDVPVSLKPDAKELRNHKMVKRDTSTRDAKPIVPTADELQQHKPLNPVEVEERPQIRDYNKPTLEELQGHEGLKHVDPPKQSYHCRDDFKPTTYELQDALKKRGH